jgi:hypothetical protein
LPDSVGTVRHKITYKSPFRNFEGAALTNKGVPPKQAVEDIDDQIRIRRSSKKSLTLRCEMDVSTKRERPAMTYAREAGSSQYVEEKRNYWSDEEVDEYQGCPRNTARSAAQPAKTLERTLRNLVCRSAFGERV